MSVKAVALAVVVAAGVVSSTSGFAQVPVSRQAVHVTALSASSADVQSRAVTATPTATATPNLVYSDGDVVNFFIFGRGPAAIARPDLLKSMNITVRVEPPAGTLDKIVSGLLSVDPSFHENVTVGLQEHDPYLAESAVRTLASDLNLLAAKLTQGMTQTQQTRAAGLAAATAAASGKSSATVYGRINYVLYGDVALSVSAVVAVVVVASIAGVFLAFYKRPGDQSDLITQHYAAAAARGF